MQSKLLTQLQIELEQELAYHDRLRAQTATCQLQRTQRVEESFNSLPQQYPIITLSTSVLRKYKPFRIHLFVPRGLLEQCGIQPFKAEALGQFFTVRQYSQPNVDIMYCPICAKAKRSILEIKPSKKSQQFERLVINEQLERYSWNDCRFHCYSSKLHFGQKLFLHLNLNDISVKSHSFASIVRIKDETKRKEVENLSYFLTLPKQPTTKPNVCAVFCLLLSQLSEYLHQYDSRSFLESLTVLAKKTVGFRSLKVQYLNEKVIHAIFISFTSELTLRPFVCFLIYYLRNEWFFQNPRKTNVICSFIPHFVDFFCSCSPERNRSPFFHSPLVFEENSIYDTPSSFPTFNVLRSPSQQRGDSNSNTQQSQQITLSQQNSSALNPFFRWDSRDYEDFISDFPSEDIGFQDFGSEVDSSHIHMVELEQQLLFAGKLQSQCDPSFEIDQTVNTREPFICLHADEIPPENFSYEFPENTESNNLQMLSTPQFRRYSPY